MAPSPEPFEESVWSLSHLINRNVTASTSTSEAKKTWTMNANPDAVMTRNGLLKRILRNDGASRNCARGSYIKARKLIVAVIRN